MNIDQRTTYFKIACRICEDFGIAVTAGTLWTLVEIIEQEFIKAAKENEENHENKF